MIYVGLDGIKQKMELPSPVNINLFRADADTLSGFERLPKNFDEAKKAAYNSQFIRTHIPEKILRIYTAG